MLARLDQIPFNELAPTLRILSDAGVTAQDAGWLRSPGNAGKLVEFLRQQQEVVHANPFVQTVSEQIEALKRANAEESWGISVETFTRLAESAPEWPQGMDSYRSFRIRFGEGDDGVTKTFEAHVTRIARMYGAARFLRSDFLRSDAASLRLLSGSASHTPVVEWITVHLDANRKRESIEAVRGPKSLADEGLALVWLFPERFEATNGDKWCAWFCAGYELHGVPGYKGILTVPCIYRQGIRNQVLLSANPGAGDGMRCSVPVSK